MGANRRLTRSEFDLWREGIEREIRDIKDWQREHGREHNQDEDDKVIEIRDRRRWNWQQVVAAISAAAVVAAAAMQALGH